jgi:hypothetical protein
MKLRTAECKSSLCVMETMRGGVRGWKMKGKRKGGVVEERG